MKKAISLLLALTLCLALAAPALAAEVVVSPQLLAVDGQTVSCEKYNIDGSNYFKLRDMAMLLRDTPAAFGIDFDAENFTVYVTCGGDYEPVGGELRAGADNSDTCVPSAWKLVVDGVPVEVSTFNIGGSNFYKLRDMGDAVGFAVDYDPATNTALIYSDAAHVAVASGMPFFSNGFGFSAPAEHEPGATWYLGDTHDPVGGILTASAPVITRSAPDGSGYVTYYITYKETGRIEFPTPKDYENYNDFGCSFKIYGLYDYYTGAEFTARTLTDTDRYNYDVLISVQGKPYQISYTTTMRPEYSNERNIKNIILTQIITMEMEIRAPQDYDGLVLALRCNGVKYEFVKWANRSVNNSDGNSSGKRMMKRWNDYDTLGEWVFVRVSDWQQPA